MVDFKVGDIVVWRVSEADLWCDIAYDIGIVTGIWRDGSVEAYWFSDGKTYAADRRYCYSSDIATEADESSVKINS